MSRNQELPVRLPTPGSRARIVSRASKGLLLCTLTIMSFIVAIPLHPGAAVNSQTNTPVIGTPGFSSQFPVNVNADRVPDLNLPRTVLSNVDHMIGVGGVIQASPDNLTIYNPSISMRLLGGAVPHDELPGLGKSRLNSWSSWGAEVQVSNQWVPLIPQSNNFTLEGTNSSGTTVERTMQVTAGIYVGELRIVYKATAEGPLRWDLLFTPNSFGRYRLVYSWMNFTNDFSLSLSTKKLEARYGIKDYTLNWGDINSTLSANTNFLPGLFQLSVDLGIVNSGRRVVVDPSLVSGSSSSSATAYSFQRKVLYEPSGGNYFVFYCDGLYISYRSSHDGTNWSTPTQMRNWPMCSGNDPSSFPDIYSNGRTIAMADGQYVTSSGSGSNTTVSLFYTNGTINGSQISWSRLQSLPAYSAICTMAPTCQITVGIRYVSVTVDSNGAIVFSFNQYYMMGCWQCAPSNYVTSIGVIDNWHMKLLGCSNNLQCTPYYVGSNTTDIQLRSVPTPSSNNGQTQIIFEYPSATNEPNGTVLTGINLYSYGFDDANNNLPPGLRTVESGIIQTLNPGPSLQGPDFSTVYDSNYGLHVIYPVKDGTIHYAYFPSISQGWSRPSSDILSGSVAFPTLTIDWSTNSLYAFAVRGSSILMRSKSPLQNWSDSSLVFPVTNRRNALTNLGSNFASASNTNASAISIIWTEGTGPYNVTFASIPIQTVWSPYGLPADPWDSNGLAPYGQYFANLGESVSPSTGMLTIRQTDLTVSGRGLDLSLTRVYTEPYSFLGGQPFNYERYPWAPLGYGWQLNFPWLNNTLNPLYIHLWDGEGYRIPSSFWNSQSSKFENHAGEHFVFLRNATGIFLYTKSGIASRFDPTYFNRLTRIIDPLGNSISIGYDVYNRISVMNDTVQRRFLFCYSNWLLASINQTTGNCQSGAGSIRGIVYKYMGQSLVTVYDPAGRATNYAYTAVSDPNVAPWLLSRITYPTNWFTSYSYSIATLGTQATTYRVYVQRTNATAGVSGSMIRRFQYSYASGGGDQVTNSFVLAYNGSSTIPATNTTYAFSFSGLTLNITDGNHRFVRGFQQLFGVHGEIPREIVLVPDGFGGIGSYTNYYRYDIWSNLIYSRKVINPSSNWYHETFSDYKNDGLPSGFYAFAESLSQANHTRTDNNWNIASGQWAVVNGEYKLTGERGNQSLIEVPHGDAAFQMTVRWLAGQYFEGYIGFRYQTNGNHYEVYLSAFDNTLRFVKVAGGTYTRLQAATVTPSKNVHYLVRVESSGYTHTVYLNGTLEFQVTDLDSGMLTGRYLALGTYSSTSPTNAEQIGFSNIYVQPLSSTFSNSFFSTSPNSNIHGVVSGIAELQNGTRSTPIETYYSYYAWGGLNQTRQLYRQSGVNRWLTTSRNYDSYGNLIKLFDPRGNSTLYSYSPTYQYAYLTTETQTLNPGGTPIARSYSYNFTDGTMLSSVDPLGHNSTYHYDVLGRLTRSTILATGDYASYSYNDRANYVNVTNEMSWKTQQLYDGLGRLSNVTRFLNNAPYSREIYTYNYEDKIVTDIDSLGNKVSYQYDSLGRTTQIMKPDSNTTSITYNDLASWTRATDENGVNKCSVYDRLGRLVSVVENANALCTTGIVTNYYYDETGNLLKTVTPTPGYSVLANPGFEAGNLTGWTVTNMNVTGVIVHSGTWAAATYTAFGQFALAQNLSAPVPASQVSSIQFWYASISQTTFSVQVLYSDHTNTTTIFPDVNSWTLASPAFDRTKQISGIRISGVYPGGQTWFDDFSIGNPATTYSYDSLNRLTMTSYPDGTSEQYVYDNDTNLVQKTDRKGVQTVYSYDSLNRLVNIAYRGTTTTNDQYSYDNNGNILSLSSQNATLTYTYDSRNRVTCETYQINSVSYLGGPCVSGGGGGSVAAGTLITLADGTNMPVQNLQTGARLLAYNVTTGQFAVSTITRTATVETNDLLVIETQDGQPLRTDNATIQKLWVKKSDGSIGWLSVTQLRVGDSLFLAQAQRWTLVTSMKDIPGQFVMYDIYTTAPFDYIANGYLDPPKLPSTSTPSGINAAAYSFKYTYWDEVLRYITYDDSSTLLYNYDGLGRILNTTDTTNSGTTYLTKFSYYSNNELKGIQYGNGLIENYTYNKLGLVSRETLNNTSTPYLILNYQYNRTGTVASVTGQVYHTSITEQYAYDALQRLVNTSLKNNSTTTTLSYVYDNVGNRLSQTINGITTTYGYNMTNNELTGSTVSGATTTYGYDKNGNLLSKNIGSNHSSYAWDVPGDLLNVTNNTVVQGYYAYDGLGRRVESKEGSSTIFYGYLGTETLAEGVTNPYTDYVYVNGLRIARVTGAYPGGSPAIVYFHTDGLGSTRLVTDANKNVLFTDNYQPFGQDSQSSGSETYKFTGKPFSAATGLYYDYRRWYDPSIGRFISQDPVAGQSSNPQSLNPYVYVENLPTSLRDPTGLLTGATCPEFCGVSSQGDWSFAALVVLGNFDIHRPGNISIPSKGDWMWQECTECSRDIRPDEWGSRDPFPNKDPTESTADRTSETGGDTVSGRGGARAVETGKLGVDASISRLGDRFIDREVSVWSPKYERWGRMDIFEREGFREVKNVRNLHWNRDLETQADLYGNAVGTENLRYDVYSDWVDPEFTAMLNRLGVAYHIYPYIPLA